MADPTPKPSPYTLVHAAGFPCGATSGRYGTPLQYDNGRDHWTDAYQEALDLVAYLHAARAPWWMRWASILFAALVRRHVTTEIR